MGHRAPPANPAGWNRTGLTLGGVTVPGVMFLEMTGGESSAVLRSAKVSPLSNRAGTNGLLLAGSNVQISSRSGLLSIALRRSSHRVLSASSVRVASSVTRPTNACSSATLGVGRSAVAGAGRTPTEIP